MISAPQIVTQIVHLFFSAYCFNGFAPILRSGITRPWNGRSLGAGSQRFLILANTKMKRAKGIATQAALGVGRGCWKAW